MKRAIYLSILAAVTVGCILWRVGSGFTNWSHAANEDDGKTVSVDHEALNQFTEIDMDVDVADITIEVGEDYSISYSAKERYCPKYEVNNGKLTVTQSIKTRGWHLGDNVTGPSELTVTVPEDAVLENVDIVSGVGDVKIDGVETERFSAELDVGDLEASDAILGEGVVDADVGNVRFRTVDFKNMDVDADVGDVDISCIGSKANYRIEAAADVGTVKINGEKVKKNADVGSDIKTGEGEYDLNVDADVGNVDLTFED